MEMPFRHPLGVSTGKPFVFISFSTASKTTLQQNKQILLRHCIFV
jgi:hypothetical protein